MSDLTILERKNVRTAIRFLHLRCGGWDSLSTLLRLSRTTIRHVVEKGRAPSPMLTFRVARLAGVPIDDVLAGKFPPAGTCPHCGQMKETLHADGSLAEDGDSEQSDEGPTLTGGGGKDPQS